MTLAATHLHPAWSLTPAAAAVAWMSWYWLRLGRPQVPASRRNIRRFSIGLMVLAVFLFVRGLSFIDGNAQPREYIITWMMALLLVVVVIAAAGLDAINNLRLLQRQSHREAADSARDLIETLRRRRDSEAGNSGRSDASSS